MVLLNYNFLKHSYILFKKKKKKKKKKHFSFDIKYINITFGYIEVLGKVIQKFQNINK